MAFKEDTAFQRGQTSEVEEAGFDRVPTAREERAWKQVPDLWTEQSPEGGSSRTLPGRNKPGRQARWPEGQSAESVETLRAGSSGGWHTRRKRPHLPYALKSTKAQGGCPEEKIRFAESSLTGGGASDKALKEAGSPREESQNRHKRSCDARGVENREVAERQAGWVQAEKTLHPVREDSEGHWNLHEGHGWAELAR